MDHDLWLEIWMLFRAGVDGVSGSLRVDHLIKFVPPAGKIGVSIAYRGIAGELATPRTRACEYRYIRRKKIDVQENGVLRVREMSCAHSG